MVINSATALRKCFLKEIDGYNEEFPLDYLDHWVSWRIFIEKKQIKILSQTLQHQLSVLDYTNHMNFSRYQAIIQAENAIILYMQHNCFHAIAGNYCFVDANRC